MDVGLGLGLGRVSLLSRCRILASAELISGCIWQHHWQPMPRSRCQNSAAVWGDAAVCWLVNSRWRLSDKICIFLSFNIYRSTQLNKKRYYFALQRMLPFTCRKWTKSAFAFRSSETFHGGVWYCGWMRFKSPKESYMCGSCTAAVNTPYRLQLPKSCRRYTNFSNKLIAVKFVYKQ